MNLVEGWFSILTRRALKQRSFTSVNQLEAAIAQWTAHWNKNPRPFTWTKPIDEILTNTRRARGVH